jgi:hypothetical protein
MHVLCILNVESTNETSNFEETDLASLRVRVEIFDDAEVWMYDVSKKEGKVVPEAPNVNFRPFIKSCGTSGILALIIFDARG